MEISWKNVKKAYAVRWALLSKGPFAEEEKLIDHPPVSFEAAVCLPPNYQSTLRSHLRRGSSADSRHVGRGHDEGEAGTAPWTSCL